MAVPLDLESQLDRLYQGPLKDFISNRKSLVRELRNQKMREDAGRVQLLGKPSLVVWVLNQLFWRRRADLERLLEMGDRMRELQQGKLSREESRLIPKERQAQIALLLSGAGTLLEESGHAAASDTLRRVSNSLDALAGWGSSHPFRLGRLGEEIRPPALEDLLQIAAAPPQRRPSTGNERIAAIAGREEKDRLRRLEEARRELLRLGEQSERLRLQLEESEGSRSAAEKAVEAARQALRQAQQGVQELDACCRLLKKESADLRGRIQAAEREVERLQRKAPAPRQKY